MDYLRICLADEAPELGCGHHFVLVVEVGERHATVFAPSSGVFATLEREGVSTAKTRVVGFDEMARASLRNIYDPEKMAERIVANCRANGNWTTEARAVCERLGALRAQLPPVAGEAATSGVALTPVGAADPDAPTTALPGEKIGGFAERLLMARHEPAAVMAFVKASFPGSKFDLSHAAWYLGKLRKKHGPEHVPAWPRSAFKQDGATR